MLNSSSTPTPSSSIRMLIVDDYEVVRQGLRLILGRSPDITVVGEAADGTGALQIVAQEQIDVILLDLELGTESGLDFLTSLRNLSGAKIVVYTGQLDTEVHEKAYALGAVAVTMKGQPHEELLDCIHEVHNNRPPTKLNAQGISDLTVPELQFIELTCQYIKPTQIAEMLGLTPTKFNEVAASVYRKLEVANSIELAIFAFRHGLVQAPNKS